MRLTRLALLIWVTALVSLCQVPPPASAPAADPIIRVSVNLVQIDAVVADSKGRHVSGLTSEDFEIFEDGKPQKITHLSYLDAPPAAERQAAPTKTAAANSPRSAELISAPSRKPRREEIRRAMVLMVDDIHTSPEDLARLKPVAKKFVADQVAPGDLVSISIVSGGMGFYEQFTSDRNILSGAVESLAKRPGGDPNPLAGVRKLPASAADCLRALMLFDAVMGKLSWAIQSLNELPGRKAVVLFSDGLAISREYCPSEGLQMTASMQRVADQSNRAGVAIYAIDARGLTVDRIFNSSFNPRAEDLPVVGLEETSDFLTAETGGIFFRNTNGISEALGKSINDMKGYYLIGFQPQRDDFELKKGAVAYHKVEVKLRRHGLSVRYGRGFLGVPENNDSNARPTTPAQQLAKALFSPFDAGAIKVRLTPLYAASPQGPNGAPSPTAVKALLSIDRRTLDLVDNAAGRHNDNAVLEVVAAAYRSDNTRIAVSSGEITVSPPENATKPAKGITYQIAVDLPKPGAYQIRAAVRDRGSGNLGSANSFVIVPDFNLARISISSLMLSAADGGDMLSQAAAREFHAGIPIVYACEIYGSKGSAEIEIRLFREGVRVFASAPMTLNPAAGAKLISVVGKLSLPESTADGDYQLELIARDPQAPAKVQSTSQWSNLTLVKSESQ